MNAETKQFESELVAYFRNKANNELLKYAVSRAIWCNGPHCHNILNMRTATLFYTSAHSIIVCPACRKKISDEKIVEQKKIFPDLEIITHQK